MLYIEKMYYLCYCTLSTKENIISLKNFTNDYSKLRCVQSIKTFIIFYRSRQNKKPPNAQLHCVVHCPLIIFSFSLYKDNRNKLFCVSYNFQQQQYHLRSKANSFRYSYIKLKALRLVEMRLVFGFNMKPHSLPKECRIM